MRGKLTDFSVLEFSSYENYLNSFTTRNDAKFLGNENTARQLAQLGYRSTNVPYDAQEFAKRTELAILELQPKNRGIQNFSQFMSPDNTDPVLLEFKNREEPIQTKKLSTIVFTCVKNRLGSDISGYIDLENSWNNAIRGEFRHTNWRAVFEGTGRLEPKSTDLSYFDKRRSLMLYNNSENFCVVHYHLYGLMFMHTGDHKLIPLGGSENPFSKNMTRTMAHSPKYGTYVFYDHIVRKKV